MTALSTKGLADSPLKRTLGYRKFTGNPVKVLLLDGNYHLHNESANGLTKIGCEVQRLPVGDSVGDLVKRLLMALVQHKPDFVLAINHIGFDEQNQIGELIDGFQIPLAIWYVDSPLFILKRSEFPAPQMTSLFLWERTLEKPMALAGAQDIHYLPLGTDPDAFTWQSKRGSKQILFVGDSMQYAQQKWGGRLSNRSANISKQLTESMLSGKRFDALLETEPPFDLPPGESKWDVWALAIYNATARARRDAVKAVPRNGLHVYGDKGWKKLLPGASFHGQVNYGQPLSQVYGSGKITLNTTSYQMPTAVNQRVFDVPMSGGFVLSDNQSDMHEHFEVGKEAICFDSQQELLELIDYFQKHESERDKITLAAKKRIEADHLYETRVASLVDAMKSRHS